MLGGRRRGSVGGSLAQFASRAAAAEGVVVGAATAPAAADASGIIDALRGAVQERDDAHFNPREEAKLALAECQSSLDEAVRDALSAMHEPLAAAVGEGAMGAAARNDLQRALLACSQRIMRSVTTCTEEVGGRSEPMRPSCPAFSQTTCHSHDRHGLDPRTAAPGGRPGQHSHPASATRAEERAAARPGTAGQQCSVGEQAAEARARVQAGVPEERASARRRRREQ